MKVARTLSGLVAASVLLAGVSSQAIPVSGVISFGGKATVTSTAVTSWIDTKVSGVTGFGGSISTGDAVTLATPWSFNSGAVSSLWSVGDFTFNLSSSSVILQAFGSVLVSGTGIITGNGFDATAGTWTFYSTVPKGVKTITTPIFTFSVAHGPALGVSPADGNPNSVPDGGTTLILLGMAFSAVALFRKLLKNELA